MRIDLAIPAYNEELVIEETVRAIMLAVAALPHDIRIIVVDNNSTDTTPDVVRSLNLPNVSVQHEPTQGKGAAVISAARISDAPIFGFIDADLSVHPKEISSLVSILEESRVDIVIGSRLLDTSKVNRSGLRTLSSRVFNYLQRFLLKTPVSDTQCGLKFMTVDAKKYLVETKEHGWFFDIEFLARAHKAGKLIQEVPITWEEFHSPNRKSKLALLPDSIKAVQTMFRIRKVFKKKNPT